MGLASVLVAPFQPDELPPRVRAMAARSLEEGGPGRLFVGARLVLPSGVRLLASSYITSEVGLFAGVVQEWGIVDQSIDLRTGGLQGTELLFTIDDESKDFATELGVYGGHRLRRSPAEVRVFGEGIPWSEGYPAFVGVLDGWDMKGGNLWQLRLRADDLALTGWLPKLTIARNDWPQASAAALGQQYPLVYGHHVGGGAVRAILVDTTGFRYLVSLGHLKAVPTVYADETIVASSGYSVVRTVVNGKWVTLLDFTSDQGTASITCDAAGLTDRPDGTGNVIDNPPIAMRHLLSQFVFGSWAGGEWLPDAAQVDSTSFADVAAWMADQGGYFLSKAFGGDRKYRAQELLNEWADSFGLGLYWTTSGRIAVAVLDLTRGDPYASVPRVIAHPHATEVRPAWDSSSIVRTVSAQHLLSTARGTYAQEFKATDLSVAEDVAYSKQLAQSLAAPSRA